MAPAATARPLPPPADSIRQSVLMFSSDLRASFATVERADPATAERAIAAQGEDARAELDPPRCPRCQEEHDGSALGMVLCRAAAAVLLYDPIEHGWSSPVGRRLSDTLRRAFIDYHSVQAVRA